MAFNISDEALTLAARLYYIDGVSQQKLAAMFNVSQAKASRLLAMARERGIVTVTVNEYVARNREQERLLIERFGLKKAVVIRVQSGQPAEQARTLIGHFAAPLITENIQTGMVIGLAGGRTIYELIESYKPHPGINGVTVIQAMGNVGSRISSIDASEVGRMLAVKGKGSFLAINAPVFTPSREIRDVFLNHEQIKEVMEMSKRMDVAFVGIGIPGNSILADQNIISEKEIPNLRCDGVCGEICGRFFDSDGNEASTIYKNKTISIELDTLRKTPLVFGVVNGSDRADAIAAAIKGKIINSLIADSECAGQLLKLDTVSGKGRQTKRHTGV